ncbi:MAG: prephenate dehydratase [Balneolaceae bacterium]
MTDKKQKDLDFLRSELDKLDESILDALTRRKNIVGEIFSQKIDGDTNIRDRNREEQVIGRILEMARKRGIDQYFVEQIFREIIHHSVRFQNHSLVDEQNKQTDVESIHVAYQGTDGAYSHMAALRHFEERYDQVHCLGFDTFKEAADAVEKGDFDYAILPVENTTAGSINDTYDILGEGDLDIVGEEVLRISHCLLALEKIPLSNIRRIISHPQALAQCTQFLSRLPRVKVESYLDTALAAKKVFEDEDLSQAAIASSQAADIYGLKIIERDIANQKGNYTRFVVVAREPVSIDLQIPCKTSLMLSTGHEKGDLLRCLNVLGNHDINMTKLESRPILGKPWKYLFYLDIEGNIRDPEVEKALDELKEEAASLKILGCYPRQVTPYQE